MKTPRHICPFRHTNSDNCGVFATLLPFWTHVVTDSVQTMYFLCAQKSRVLTNRVSKPLWFLHRNRSNQRVPQLQIWTMTQHLLWNTYSILLNWKKEEMFDGVHTSATKVVAVFWGRGGFSFSNPFVGRSCFKLNDQNGRGNILNPLLSVQSWCRWDKSTVLDWRSN